MTTLRISVTAAEASRGVAAWIRNAASAVNSLIGRVDTIEGFTAPSYAVADLPSADAGKVVYVTDESGGAVLAVGDGTDFRRTTDRAVVS